MPGSLIRGLGLWPAVSANMLAMMGIGPFVTIPLILSAMHGPQALLGWLLGALISLCDGLVWAELGAALPGSGGSYVYLQEGFGPLRFGRLMSFLFLWGAVVTAPLNIASGGVGFAQYLKYFWTAMPPWEGKLIAAGLCLLATWLVYQDIPAIGRLSIWIWAVVMGMSAWIVLTGAWHFSLARALDFPPDAFHFSPQWFRGLGEATLLAVYAYGGYCNVCLVGGEVQNPARTIPRSIIYSIFLVAALYLSMNLSVIGVIPWREAMQSSAVVSIFIERLHGVAAGRFLTVLILWTCWAGLFANILGSSRVPYAAATQGRFFRVFARLHPVKQFPAFSVLFLGISSALACMFDLGTIINALMVLQILVQFAAQIIALALIRRSRPDIARPFQMWLYPLPSAVALAGWLFVLASSGWVYIAWGLALIAAGIAAYLWRARRLQEWPFVAAVSYRETTS